MNAIELHDLSKMFDGRMVLNELSFSVRQGEMFGLLGPNGAGKTTTMRLMLGLLRPSSGTALVNGANLGTDDEARQQVGVLMENDGLYDKLSARDNLDYFARIYRVARRKERIDALLSQFSLQDRAGDRVATFSKGMRRKLGIARAMIHDPHILLLDEPTSGLDPEAQKMVREILQDLSRMERMTVLLSSHNLDEVQRICSRVAVIKRGRLRACDTVENLRGGGRNEMRFSLPKGTEERAASILSPFPQVLKVEVSEGGVLVNLDGQAFPLIRALVSEGIEIEEAIRVSRSLEDVYIDLVKEESS